LINEIKANKEHFQGKTIVMNFFSEGERGEVDARFVSQLQGLGITVVAEKGSIEQVLQPRDLVVNSWDPHSVPGNGNDSDRSVDGALGAHTTIGQTQNGYLNPHLFNDHNYTLI
jgi:hypothetical protein